MIRPTTDPRFQPGDLVVAPAPDGCYQVARVPGNGRSEHVLGYQKDCQAALKTACGATSGGQHVYLWADADATEYREFTCV